MRNIHTMIIFGLVFLLAAPALARPGGKTRDGIMNPQRIERMATKLGVSDDVKENMKRIVYEAKRKSIELKSKLELGRVNLQELMDSDAPDRSVVMAQIDALGTLQIEMRKLKLGTMLDIRALLTPEQRNEMKRFLRKRGKRGRRGQRGKRGKRARHLRRQVDDGDVDGVTPEEVDTP